MCLFCLCVSPGFPLGGQFNLLLTGIYRNGVGISHLRPFHVQGLRNANYRERTTQKAHADMYNLNTSLTSKDETRTLTYRADTYCCFVCGRVRNLRSFKVPRTKRQVNVFSIYMYFPLSHTSLTEVSAWKTRQRYGIINRIENNSHFLYP